jgi:filamentous hemagglutinin family protein
MNAKSSARKQRQIRLSTTFCAAILFVHTQTVQANPVGGSVVNGSAGFATSGNTLTVTNTPGTIINWQGFSINSNEVTNFAQQSAASTVLNRVVGSDPSNILGTLQSNGRVFLVNPNGILFGAGAVVDVAGLVASTLNLSDADFLAGNNHFTQVPGAANISNAGNVSAQQGGQIYLIAPNVENTGVITAPNGEILLAAGYSVDLVSTDDPNLRVNITAPAGDATNIGQLIASSGSLGLFGTVVSNSGIVSADSATMQGGKIVFKATQRVEAGGGIGASGASGGSVDISVEHSLDPDAPGVVLQTGAIEAQGSTGPGGSVSMSADSNLSAAAINTDGATAGGQISVQAANRALATASAQYTADSTLGEGGDILVSADVSNYSSGSYSATGVTGGNITMAGNEIKLAGAQLDTSGTYSGGTIRVGGLMHGAAGFAAQGVALGNATNVLVNSATVLKADALQTGDGGEVVLWSNRAMSFTGSISAKGGALSGNGGNAEVSGLTSFGYGGLTDLSAANGLNGTLLLDPNNITIVAGSGLPYQEIIDPTTGTGEGFGGATNIGLGNGNIVVASPLDSFAGTNSGAVYLFSPAGSLVSTLLGSTAGDQVGSGGISTLTGSNSNNFVVQSPNWSNAGAAGAGAVTWMNGTTGLLSTGIGGGAVSASNSLVGSTAGDSAGSYGVTALSNGNYVVNTPYWTDLSGLSQVGAVSWGNGSTGTAGTIADTNSLVGSKANDHVGIGGVTALGNGNYVVSSYSWNGGLGAVTWNNGLGGTVGQVTSSNSLVGNIATDSIGNGGVTALSNANYVVSSYSWSGGFGAVTWGNGLGGTVGQVTSSNSLVGSLSTDQIGLYGGIISLANGNYLVQSSAWNNNAGAVTFGNGSSGTIGAVSASNSLTGSSSGDQVGSSVTVLPGSSYVVSSYSWNGGLGAVTWGNGTTGTVGPVTSANSLVGSTTTDNVGNGGITVLANGNYVVDSYSWNGGLGAVTWANGSGGTTGAVTPANSLVGSTAGDNVGNGGVTALTNGNYVVDSYYWNNGAATQGGAVTWVNGANGYIDGSASKGGVVSASNSLVGTNANDWVGINGITPLLVNGNYVVSSSYWNGGLGAVTWGNGSGGTVGAVTASKSLVGSIAGDSVGSDGVTALTNGNYLVSSTFWNGGYGAMTWGNGSVGTAGVVSAANSLVGSTIYDRVGSSQGRGNIIELNGNGNLVITDYNWGSTSTAAGLGSVTWMNGANGKLADGTSGGAISAANSLVGSTAGDLVGSSCDCTNSGYVISLANGNYAVMSPSWSNGLLSGAGAVTIGNGTAGTVGTVSAANSLVGTAANEYLGNDAFELTGQPGKVLIASAGANNGDGGVYLLGGTATLANGKLLFADSLGVDAPTGAALISSTLNAGTNVVLQAYNDITQLPGAAINATGAGNLTLQAGNNVVLNDVINVKGKLDISANDPAAAQASGTGVLDSSKATLTASQINLINYGSADVSIGFIHGGSGAVTVVATGGNFINNSGSTKPITTTGKISVYSNDPALDTLNGMVSNYHLYNCTYASGCQTPGTIDPGAGTGLYYSLAPTLAVAADAVSKVYGASDALTYSATGFVAGDTIATPGMFTGALGRAAGESVTGGPYAINQGTLASSMGYTISTFTPNNLTITPALLTVAANGTNKILSTADPPLTYSVSGLQFSDTAATTLNPVTISRSAGETVGNYLISVSTSLTAGLASTNYTLSLAGANFTILARTVINEMVDISNPKQKKKEDVLALNLPAGDRGNMQGLPMCN